jgi:MoaA/NifB/PqqE/SkfB family radical SAM enzyme
MTESIRDTTDSPCCFRSIKGPGVRLIWEITSRCNLDCVHCFVDKDAPEIDTETALAVIDEFPTLPVRKVMFTGGEPFLRDDMFVLLEAAAAQQVLVDVTTNLTYLDVADVSRLRDLGIDEITTSLDGPEPVHQRIRRSTSCYGKLAEAITFLEGSGVAVDIVCVAQRANADVIRETIDTASALGAASITISGFNSQGAARSKAGTCSLNNEQLVSVRTQIEGARAHYGDSFPIRTVGLLKRFGSTAACPVEDIMAINSRGEAQSCLLAPVPPDERFDIRMGLSDAWNALDRGYCCAQSGWADPLVVDAPTSGDDGRHVVE